MSNSTLMSERLKVTQNKVAREGDVSNHVSYDPMEWKMCLFCALLSGLVFSLGRSFNSLCLLCIINYSTTIQCSSTNHTNLKHDDDMSRNTKAEEAGMFSLFYFLCNQLVFKCREP